MKYIQALYLCLFVRYDGCGNKIDFKYALELAEMLFHDTKDKTE